MPMYIKPDINTEAINANPMFLGSFASSETVVSIANPIKHTKMRLVPMKIDEIPLGNKGENFLTSKFIEPVTILIMKITSRTRVIIFWMDIAFLKLFMFRNANPRRIGIPIKS